MMELQTGSLHGTVVRSSAVAGLTLTETDYSEGLRLAKHAHRFAFFCLVLEGRFTEFYEKGCRACRASTLIFHPSGEAHADHFHSAARCFNLVINPQWLDRARQHSVILETPSAFQGGRLAQLTTRLYKEFRHMDQVSPLIIEGLTIEILGEVTRYSLTPQRRTTPPWLDRAQELLHDRFREGLTLSKVANLVGVHPVHLARVFRHHHRCSIGDYILRLRLDFACRKMVNSNISLAEVSLEAGFSHQSHFSNTFKKFMGMTPAEYRAAFRVR